MDGGGYLKPFVTVYRMTMGDVNIKNLSDVLLDGVYAQHG